MVLELALASMLNYQTLKNPEIYNPKYKQPPAIVETYEPKNNLETLVAQNQAFMPSNPTTKIILDELEQHFADKPSLYVTLSNPETGKKEGVEFFIDKKDDYIPVVIRYTLGENGKPAFLAEIIYMKKNENPLRFLYDLPLGDFQMEEPYDWKNSKRIFTIIEGDKELTKKLNNLYKEIKRIREEIKKEDEGKRAIAQLNR